MICEHCAQEIPNNESTCPFCGQMAHAEVETATTKAEKTNLALSSMLWGIGGIAVTWQVNMLLGLIFSIISLVKANQYKKKYGTPSSLVCVGQNLSIISIVISAVTILTLVSIIAAYICILLIYVLFILLYFVIVFCAGFGMMLL